MSNVVDSIILPCSTLPVLPPLVQLYSADFTRYCSGSSTVVVESPTLSTERRARLVVVVADPDGLSGPPPPTVLRTITAAVLAVRRPWRFDVAALSHLIM